MRSQATGAVGGHDLAAMVGIVVIEWIVANVFHESLQRGKTLFGFRLGFFREWTHGFSTGLHVVDVFVHKSTDGSGQWISQCDNVEGVFSLWNQTKVGDCGNS